MELFLTIIGDFLMGVLGFLILESSKHFFAGTFNLYSFFLTNIKPLLWSVIGGIVIAAFVVFLPEYVPFIEANIGDSITTEWSNLLLTGGILGALIKALFERKKTKAKVFARSIPGDGFKDKE